MRQKPIAIYEDFIGKFPSVTAKSKLVAKTILPLYPSSNLAKIIAALMTDGHIDWYTSDGSPRTRKIILYSSNREECKWFLELCKNLFGTEGKVITYIPKYGNFKKQPYKAVIHNAVIARILILCGAPAGNKTEQEFLVPEWIMNGNKKIKKEFLKFLFNFEGSVPLKRQNRPCSWRIGFYISKSKKYIENAKQFLNQIKSLFNEFEISCSRTGCTEAKNSLGKCPVVHFSISNQKSIVNYYRYMGFYNTEKQKKLENSVLDITRMGRVKSKHISDLLKRTKERFGTDRKLLAEINNLAFRNYTCRQIEHFRRMETKTPYDVLFTIIKITNKKEILNQLPSHVKFLYNFTVPSFRQ